MSVHATLVQEDDLRLAAQSHVPVLITSKISGERAMSARVIHDNSARGHGPFITFGRDADAALRHHFEQARGGTLFVDDITDLTTNAQRQLFSLLDEPSPHGDVTTPHAIAGVRIIAGASCSLGGALAAKTFFEPLFYRLNVIHIDSQTRHDVEIAAKRARDVMTTPAYTCQPSTDLAAVAKLMWDHDCGFVPVVDASGQLAGAITDRDICFATATRRLLPEHIAAGQVMTAPIHVCLADDHVADALATMRQFKVRRLPVVDAAGRLQGVISLNDLVLAADQKGSPAAGDIMATLAAICAHRSVSTAVA